MLKIHRSVDLPESLVLRSTKPEPVQKQSFIGRILSRFQTAPTDLPPGGPSEDHLLPAPDKPERRSQLEAAIRETFFYPGAHERTKGLDKRISRGRRTERDVLCDSWNAQPEELKTKDGARLDILHMPGLDNERTNGPTVVLIPPNRFIGENLIEWAKPYAKEHINVVLLSLRGYGKSEGYPDELGTYTDVQTVHDWLIERGVSPSDILYHGISIGGAVAAAVAEHNPGTHLIVDQTFTTLSDVTHEVAPLVGRLAVKILFPKGKHGYHGYVSDAYNTEEKLKRVTGEVLVISAKQDKMMPQSFANRLFAARYPKAQNRDRLITIPGEHVTNLFDYSVEARKAFEQFLQDIQFTS